MTSSIAGLLPSHLLTLSNNHLQLAGHRSKSAAPMAPLASQQDVSKRIFDLQESGVPVLLEGPPGTGKTALIRALAATLGRPYLRIPIHCDTQASDLFGRPTLDASGNPQWCEGPVVKSMREGGFLVLDELDLADAGVLASLNHLLDFNRAPGPLGRESEVVEAHPDFRIFVTTNGSTQQGRNPLSQELVSRFTKLCIQAPTEQELKIMALHAFEQASGHPAPKPAIDKLVRAHMDLCDMQDDLQSPESMAPVQFGPRELLRSVRRLAAISPKPGGAANELMARAAREVYLEGLGEEATRLKGASIMQYALPLSAKTPPVVPSLVPCEGGYKFGELFVPRAAHLPPPLMLAPGVTEQQRRACYMALLALHCGEHPALVGHMAAGKSYVVKLLGDLLVKEVIIVGCHKEMSQRDITGGHTLEGFRYGPLPRAARQGAILFLDELNTLPAEAMDQLNAALDGETHLVLPQNGGERVDLDQLLVVAAMNPPTYESREMMSQAMRSRLSEIRVNPPSSVQELATLAQRSMGGAIDAATQGCLVGAIVTLHAWVRDKYEEQELGDALAPADRPNFTLRQLQTAARVMATKTRLGASPATAFGAAATSVYALRSPQASDRPVIAAEIESLTERLSGAAASLSPAAAPKQNAVTRVTINYEGGTYVGEVKDGVPHGHGSLSFADGRGYTGDFVSGKRHGEGREIYEDERVYDGAFADGLRHDEGSLTGAHESRSGLWVRGDLQRGTLNFSGGDTSTGETREGLPHGEGTYTYATGESVSGMFQAGIPDASCKITLADGQVLSAAQFARQREDAGSLSPTDSHAAPKAERPKQKSSKSSGLTSGDDFIAGRITASQAYAQASNWCDYDSMVEIMKHARPAQLREIFANGVHSGVALPTESVMRLLGSYAPRTKLIPVVLPHWIAMGGVPQDLLDLGFRGTAKEVKILQQYGADPKVAFLRLIERKYKDDTDAYLTFALFEALLDSGQSFTREQFDAYVKLHINEEEGFSENYGFGRMLRFLENKGAAPRQVTSPNNLVKAGRVARGLLGW